MSSVVNVFVHAIYEHSQNVPRAKSGAFRFHWTDSHDSTTTHSVALVLLYNMNLERSFSIE